MIISNVEIANKFNTIIFGGFELGTEANTEFVIY